MIIDRSNPAHLLFSLDEIPGSLLRPLTAWAIVRCRLWIELKTGRIRGAYLALLGSDLYDGDRVWAQIDREIRRVLKRPAFGRDRIRVF